MHEPVLLAEERWHSHPGNVQLARQAARAVALRFADKCSDFIELAVGEACANAVEHGSPRGEANVFLLRCLLAGESSELIFEIEDEGLEFALTDVSIACTPDLMSEHGRGLFLMNSIMDEVILHRTPRGLSVRMVKHLAPSPDVTVL